MNLLPVRDGVAFDPVGCFKGFLSVSVSIICQLEGVS